MYWQWNALRRCACCRLTRDSNRRKIKNYQQKIKSVWMWGRWENESKPMGRAQKHDRNLQFNIQKELRPRMGCKSSPFKSSHFLSIQENKKKNPCVKSMGKGREKVILFIYVIYNRNRGRITRWSQNYLTHQKVWICHFKVRKSRWTYLIAQ